MNNALNYYVPGWNRSQGYVWDVKVWMAFHQILFNVNNQAVLECLFYTQFCGGKGVFWWSPFAAWQQQEECRCAGWCRSSFLLLRATEESCFSLTVRKGFRLCVSCSLQNLISCLWMICSVCSSKQPRGSFSGSLCDSYSLYLYSSCESPSVREE